MCDNYITKENLMVGRAYYVEARNFDYAIWDGDAFNGVRYKMGTYFVDKEYHWDDGAPYGTVKPLELLETCTVYRDECPKDEG